MRGFGHEDKALNEAVGVNLDEVIVEEPVVEIEDATVEDEVEAAVEEEAVEERPTEINVELNEVARDVLRGVYGNGARRERLLREAGYNPEAVQAVVNAMIG